MGIGYNRHLHGQNNTVSLINLMALSGNIGRPGCGPFSMTGQPNAMGERLTGGLTGRLPFNEGLSNVAWRDHIAKVWRIPPERLASVAKEENPGMAIGMMERALKGNVKAMFLIYATHIDLPDQNTLVRPALNKTFNVVQEIYRHAPNNLYADVILPAATWGEWVGGTYIQSERRFYVCDGTANPIRGTKPDMDMVIDKGRAIATALDLDADAIFPYKKMANGFYNPEERLPRHRHCVEGLGLRPDGNAQGRGARRRRPLRSDPQSPRDPVAGPDLRDRSKRRYQAPLHGAGGVGRQAVRRLSHCRWQTPHASL